MKVLYAASTGSHITLFHLPYIRWLCRRGDEVHVMAPTCPVGLPEAAVFEELPLEKKLSSPKNFRCAMALAKRLHGSGYDVVCLNTSLASFFIRFALMLAGGRQGMYVVNISHGYLFGREMPLLRRTLLGAAEKLVACVTDRVVVMNARDLRLAQRRALCRGDVVPIDGMGVDFRRFERTSAERRAAARDEFGFADEAVVMVCAAEFSQRKNQQFLIRALTGLPREVKLLLPGQGELFERCKSEAESLGVADRVVFPGQMRDVERALAAADIYVTASMSEGLPFSVMEAMHTGLPVVASAVAGHTDLLRGGGGYLYRPGDTGAFTDAVIRLLDARRRRRLGVRAAEIGEKYSIESVFRRNVDAMGFLHAKQIKKSKRRNSR